MSNVLVIHAGSEVNVFFSVGEGDLGMRVMELKMKTVFQVSFEGSHLGVDNLFEFWINFLLQQLFAIYFEDSRYFAKILNF